MDKDFSKDMRLGWGLDLMSQMLSSDWDDDIFMEYKAGFSASYLFNNIRAKASYIYSGIALNSFDLFDFYSTIGVGLEAKF